MKVADCRVTDELVRQARPQVERPATAGTARQRNAHPHSDATFEQRLAVCRANDPVVLGHLNLLGAVVLVAARRVDGSSDRPARYSGAGASAPQPPDTSSIRHPWSVCPSIARARGAPQPGHLVRSAASWSLVSDVVSVTDTA